MAKKSALITGATGFIGSHLVRRLASDDWDIHVIVRTASQSQHSTGSRVCVHRFDGSLESLMSSFQEASPDVVFHLASLFLPTHQKNDVRPLIESNVLFGTFVLQAMADTGVSRIVNAGTSWQHFKDADYDPVCLYAATKEAFESVLTFFVQARNFSAITLKIFDTFGPGDTRPKLFKLLRDAASTGQTLCMSPGDQLLDLVYIDDVVNAFVTAARLLLDHAVEGERTYAVRSGRPMKLREIVETYERISGNNVRVDWGARAYRDREVMVPWTKGDTVPSWTPTVGLEEGIRRMEAVAAGAPAQ